MQVGLERLSLLPDLVATLRAARVGVLAHPASITASCVHLSDVLARLSIAPCIFFGPEHGYGGEAQDMISVADARDAHTGAPVVSLYGDSPASLSPSEEQLAGLDWLVIDLADVGARYYTFVWTALLAVRAAARLGVRCLLLDRPNPLGDSLHDCEGGFIEPACRSFVGWESIPVRHGLTLGEIVALFAQRDGISLGPRGLLAVVPSSLDEGRRCAWQWSFPFVPPSPNMPSWTTALVYPGGCLIEGTNLSEGRGTTRPFEMLGAPWLDGRALARRLHDCELPGVVARPISFRPGFHKHAGQTCGGVFVHVLDPGVFRPYHTYLTLLALVHELAPEHFRFRTERYEFVDEFPAMDLLTGSAAVREEMLAGRAPLELAGEHARVPSTWTEQVQEARDAHRRALFAQLSPGATASKHGLADARGRLFHGGHDHPCGARGEWSVLHGDGVRVLESLDRIQADEQARDVVLSAVGVCALDHLASEQLEIGAPFQQLNELIIVQHPAQTIRAEQVDIAGLWSVGLEIHGHVPMHPEGAGDDVLGQIVLLLIGQVRHGLQVLVEQGVISSQLSQLAFAKAIAAAVPHMADIEPVLSSRVKRTHHGGAHALQIPVAFASIQDLSVRDTDPSQEAILFLGEILIEMERPGDLFAHRGSEELGNGGGGQRTRDLPRSVPSHAIRDDEEREIIQNKEAILVSLALHSPVRQAGRGGFQQGVGGLQQHFLPLLFHLPSQMATSVSIAVLINETESCQAASCASSELLGPSNPRLDTWLPCGA